MQTKMNIRTLVALLLLVVIDTMGVGLIFPVLSPLFLQTSGGMLPASAPLALREFLYSMNLSIFAVFMFLASPLLGDMSDRFGRKKVLLFCLFGTAFSSVISAIGISLDSVSLLLISRIFSGITAGSQAIAQAAIIDLSHRDNKTRNIGLLSMASCIGLVFGPIFGGFLSDKNLVSWFNYATPFYADAILALINGVLLIFSFAETFKPKTNIKFKISESLKVFTEAITNKEIRALSLGLLGYEIAWSLYFQYIAIYLVRQFNFGPSGIGLLMSFIGFVLALTFLVLIRIALKFVRERELVIHSLWIGGAAMFFPSIFTSIKAQWLIIIPISIAVGFIWNAILALFSNSAHDEQQGWAMGIANGVTSMAWIIGSLLTGLLGYFSVYFPFQFCGLLMFLSLVALLFFKPKKQAQN